MGSRANRQQVDRLGSLDRLMLAASRRWPQDVGALAILDGAGLLDDDGRVRIDAVRATIASRLHVAPRLRQVVLTPRRGLGGPVWVDAAHFDVRDHVLVRPLPAGTDEAGLLAVTEELRRERLDAALPRWRLWLMPGLQDGRVALYVRLHHTIADGVAAMTTVAALLDRTPDAAIAAPAAWSATPPPSDRDLIGDNLRRRLHAVGRAATTVLRPVSTARRVRTSWPAIRELFAERPSDATSLDRIVGPDRALGVLRFDLDDVAAAAHEHGATVNDVLLALTAGGLRTVLRARGEPTEHVTLRTYVPVSLRTRRDTPQQGNLIAQMAVPLDLSARPPHVELREIAAETRVRKGRARTSLGDVIRGRVASRILLVAVMRQRVNVTTASIPGPTTPLHLCGATVLEVFPVLPLIANEPLGVGALSYAGRLGIGVVADPAAYPDLARFLAGGVDALLALGVTTRSAPAVTGGLG
jgi:WS/DGAT/MGAT family acyltransferase